MEEYIEFDVYLEIENVQYGRMLPELFENLTQGCLNRLFTLNVKKMKRLDLLVDTLNWVINYLKKKVRF